MPRLEFRFRNVMALRSYITDIQMRHMISKITDKRRNYQIEVLKYKKIDGTSWANARVKLHSQVHFYLS